MRNRIGTTRIFAALALLLVVLTAACGPNPVANQAAAYADTIRVKATPEVSCTFAEGQTYNFESRDGNPVVATEALCSGKGQCKSLELGSQFTVLIEKLNFLYNSFWVRSNGVIYEVDLNDVKCVP